MPKRVRVGSETVVVPTVHDMLMGPAGVQHGRTAEDRAWATSMARRDAVIEKAPDSGCATAWSALEVLNLHGAVQPISMQSLTPTAEPFPDAAAVVDWYEEHPADGVAVRTGDRGGWGLLGLHVKRWGAWGEWLRADWMDEIIKTFGEYDKPAAVRNLRPTGDTTVVRWEAAPADPTKLRTGVRVGPVTRGHVAGRVAALQALRDLVTGPDGGWLLWPVRLVDGRLPRFRSRSLTAELEVLPDGYPIPMAGVRNGLCLRTAGRPLQRPEDSSTAWLPAELAWRFGGRL
jgi:hypothetical protein